MSRYKNWEVEVWWLLLLAAMGIGSASPSEAVAQGQLQNQDKIRAEFLELAPYVSMDGEIWLEMLDTEKVVGKVSRIGQYANRSFDSHPTLASVGKKHMEFLIQQESQVIPTLRAKDLSFEGIVLELMSRHLENQVVLRWQLEADQTHRSHYSQLMPIVQELSAEPEANNKDFAVRIGSQQAIAENNSTVSLKNATLVATFQDWAGNEIKGYYFVPEWKANSEYKLRTPIETSMAGTRSIVGVWLEVYSASKSLKGISAYSAENLQAAIDEAVQKANQLIRYDPVAVLEMFKNGPVTPLGGTPDPRIRELQADAKSAVRKQYVYLRQQLQSLRKQVRIQEAQQKRMRGQQGNMFAEMQLKNNQTRLAQLEAQVDRLAAYK
ncbi:hypothetical protein AB1L30_13230 [Bremerella sp. JC817]|uniref:hypothetical protein n=1 Tax=Bremerella sp. JC817 TaxID=3231756 RepID=UPI00345AE1D5